MRRFLSILLDIGLVLLILGVLFATALPALWGANSVK